MKVIDFNKPPVFEKKYYLLAENVFKLRNNINCAV